MFDIKLSDNIFFSSKKNVKNIYFEINYVYIHTCFKNIEIFTSVNWRCPYVIY